MRLFACASAVLVLAVFLAGACGGEEEAVPEPVPLEEYLRALETARKRADERSYDDPSDGNLASEEGRAYLADTQAILRDFIAEMEALDPPEQVASAHDRLLGAMKEAEQYTENFLARPAAAETDEERTLLNAEFFEAPRLAEIEKQFTAACSELQQAAESESIEVTLNCLGEVTGEQTIDELLQLAAGEPTCAADACLCEEGSCPTEVRVTLNGIPGRADPRSAASSQPRRRERIHRIRSW